MAFAKAVRMKARLRLALTGPSGSGKTWGALEIAKGLGGRIALIDTEKGSASLYSNRAEFDVLELAPPFTPEAYIKAIREAEAAKYDILIIDSVTHEWNGSGGILELVDQVAGAKYRGNTWSAWSELTPRHRQFIDAMMQSNMHIIATGRSKTETAQVEENGRKKVVKLGMKTEQRDGFEYEMTLVLDITHEGHYALASKDRTNMFGGDPKRITEDTGKQLRDWLESGVTPTLSPSAIADFLLIIKEANTEDELKSAYTEAYKAAKYINDTDALSCFEKEKDARKLTIIKTDDVKLTSGLTAERKTDVPTV